MHILLYFSYFKCKGNLIKIEIISQKKVVVHNASYYKKINYSQYVSNSRHKRKKILSFEGNFILIQTIFYLYFDDTISK